MLEQRQPLAARVVCGDCLLTRRCCYRLRLREPARPEERIGEIEVKLDAAPLEWEQRDGPLEQVDGSAEVVAE